MKRLIGNRYAAVRPALVTLLCLMAAVSCQPQIIYRERTREEKEALGARAEVPPYDPLLSVTAEAPIAESEQELARTKSELEKLAKAAPMRLEMRRWQVIFMHNRAVLLHRLGRSDEARRWFDQADKTAELLDLAELRWQVLYSKAMARDGDLETLAAAANVLETEPAARDDEFNAAKNAKIMHLYGLRVKELAQKQRMAESLSTAENAMAVFLCRSALPRLTRVAIPELDPLVRSYRTQMDVYKAMREQLAALPLPDEDTTRLRDFEDLRSKMLEKKKGVIQTARAIVEEQYQLDLRVLAALLYPRPADLQLVQEILAPDLGVLVFFPVPGGVASWTITFEGSSVHFTEADVDAWEDVLRADPASGRYQQMIASASEALIAPLEQELPANIRRLYVVSAGSLFDLPWAQLELRGKPMIEQVQLAFAGGLDDLTAAFSRKSFTHSDILVSYVGNTAPGFVTELPKSEHFYFLDLNRSDREDWLSRSKFADVCLLTSDVVVNDLKPLDSFLRFPGALGKIQGVTFHHLATQRYKSYALCLGGWRPGTPGSSYHVLRPILRAAIVAGFPAIVVSDGLASPDGETRFWKGLITHLSTEPIGAACRTAQLETKSAGVQSADWLSYRLYGYVGLDPDEFRAYARDAFRKTAGQANKAFRREDWTMSVRYYNELLTLSDALGLNDIFISQIHDAIATSWAKMRDYDNASRSQRLLIARLERAPLETWAGRLQIKDLAGADEETRRKVESHRARRIGLAYQTLGAQLTKAERYDAAIEAFTEASNFFQKHGFVENVRDVLSQKALSHDQAGDYDAALRLFQRLRETYKEANRPASQAQQLEQMGAIQLKRLNNYFRAEQLYRQARTLYEAAGNEVAAANARISIALARRKLGDLKGALDMLKSVGETARKLDDQALLARTYTELGNTYWYRSKYQDAFDYVRRSNDIATRLGDPMQLNINQQLEGLIYWELNQFDLAHKALDRAMVYAREAENRLEVASAWNNKGIIYRRQGELTEAIDSFNQALQIDKKLRSRWGQAYDYRNIGITFRLMGRLEKSAENIRQAVDLTRKIGDDINLAKSLSALGDTLLEMRKLDEAKGAFEDALQIAEKLLLRDVMWRSQYGLARVELARKKKAEALKYLEDAVEVVETVRGEIKIEEFRSGYLRGKTDLYETIVTVLVDLEKPRQAFNYSERSRARSFIDIFSNAAFELRTPEQQRLYGQQQDLLVKIREKEQQLSAATDPEKLKEISSEVEKLKEQYSKLLLEIRLQHPQLSSFVQVEVISIEDLQKLIDPDVALITYYTTDQELFAWRFRRDEVRLFRLPLQRSALQERIRDFRSRIQVRDDLMTVREMSETIYQSLLAPVVGDLDPQVKFLGIVPHGPLHYLSFASLYGYRGEAELKQYLIEKYALFYSPSASVLQHTLTGGVPEKKRELNVLAVGNPDVGDPRYALPFAEKEVTSIRRDFVNVVDRTGDKAKESWIKQHLGKFQVIHFASHGDYDEVNPLFSALMLSPDATSDGELEVHELTGIELNAVLVTLSACQTGLGKVETGDSLISLSRAFVYAGTRSIISTLWRVDDVSTAILIKHFYRNFVEMGAAESLRRAQLQVLNDGRHAHPMYWAGVTLTGDYR